MYQMILAFRDSTGYNGLSLYAEGLPLNKIISNIGKLALTEKPLTTFEEIKNIVGFQVIFSGVTENEFREYTEIKKRISDKNGLFDDVISYHLNDYLLFDLVDNLVIFPDYEEFESDSAIFLLLKNLSNLYIKPTPIPQVGFLTLMASFNIQLKIKWFFWGYKKLKQFITPKLNAYTLYNLLRQTQHQ